MVRTDSFRGNADVSVIFQGKDVEYYSLLIDSSFTFIESSISQMIAWDFNLERKAFFQVKFYEPTRS